MSWYPSLPCRYNFLHRPRAPPFFWAGIPGNPVSAGVRRFWPCGGDKINLNRHQMRISPAPGPQTVPWFALHHSPCFMVHFYCSVRLFRVYTIVNEKRMWYTLFSVIQPMGYIYVCVCDSRKYHYVVLIYWSPKQCFDVGLHGLSTSCAYM